MLRASLRCGDGSLQAIRRARFQASMTRPDKAIVVLRVSFRYCRTEVLHRAHARWIGILPPPAEHAPPPIEALSEMLGKQASRAASTRAPAARGRAIAACTSAPRTSRSDGNTAGSCATCSTIAGLASHAPSAATMARAEHPSSNSSVRDPAWPSCASSRSVYGFARRPFGSGAVAGH